MESICRKFLCTCNTLLSRKAPVAWSNFHKPKSASGWNVIDMALWNKATILKDKVWVRWVHAYYIKRRDIFTIAISSNTSWLLRKILDSRRLLDHIDDWSTITANGKFNIQKTYSILMDDQEKMV